MLGCIFIAVNDPFVSDVSGECLLWFAVVFIIGGSAAAGETGRGIIPVRLQIYRGSL